MLNESKYHLAGSEILDEQKAVEEAKANPAKFEVLYNRYYEPILQFVYKRVEGKEAAYDITAQVFLNAMVSLKGYKFMGLPFSSWLYRIALNEINKLYRADKIKREMKTDETELSNMIEEINAADEIEKRHEKITAAIGELGEEDLQLVELRFFEKRAFKEIAEIINVTENNAKVKLYRVIDKLKKKLVLNVKQV